MEPERNNNPKRKVAPFIKKLFLIVNEIRHHHIISYCTHAGIKVHDMGLLETQVLPEYFSHNNYRSFTRQLSAYSFFKTKFDDDDGWVWANNHFVQGRPELLPKIIRRKQKQCDDERLQPPKGSKLLQCVAQAIPNIIIPSSSQISQQQETAAVDGDVVDDELLQKDDRLTPLSARFAVPNKQLLLLDDDHQQQHHRQQVSSSVSTTASSRPFSELLRSASYYDQSYGDDDDRFEHDVHRANKRTRILPVTNDDEEESTRGDDATIFTPKDHRSSISCWGPHHFTSSIIMNTTAAKPTVQRRIGSIFADSDDEDSSSTRPASSIGGWKNNSSVSSAPVAEFSFLKPVPQRGAMEYMSETAYRQVPNDDDDVDELDNYSSGKSQKRKYKESCNMSTLAQFALLNGNNGILPTLTFPSPVPPSPAPKNEPRISFDSSFMSPNLKLPGTTGAALVSPTSSFSSSSSATPSATPQQKRSNNVDQDLYTQIQNSNNIVYRSSHFFGSEEVDEEESDRNDEKQQGEGELLANFIFHHQQSSSTAMMKGDSPSSKIKDEYGSTVITNLSAFDDSFNDFFSDDGENSKTQDGTQTEDINYNICFGDSIRHCGGRVILATEFEDDESTISYV